MEEHFLKEHVDGMVRQPPEPWYNADGDCIVYQMIDEAVVAERVDEVLTIYRSAISGKSIGYQIKGVGALATKFGWEGIIVASKQEGEELKQVSLTALLMMAYGDGPKTIRRRKAYAEACESSAFNSRMRTDDLPALVQTY
jgi:hypothetical protein